MKRLGFAFIFLLFVINLFASNARVNYLGNGWLVPDEYVDITYNPARITSIDGFRLYLNSDFAVNWYEQIGIFQHENTSIEINPYTMLVGKANDLYLGLSSRSHYSDYYGLYISDAITVYTGAKINDGFYFGMNIGISSSRTNLFAYYIAALGIDIYGDNYSWGLMVSGTNTFDRIIDYNRYSFTINILPEYRINENLTIRGLCSFMYSEGNDTQNVPSFIQGVDLGTKGFDNRLGISFLSNFNGIKYIIEAVNYWVPLSLTQNYTWYNALRQLEDVKYNDFKFNIGFELPVFVDYIKMRYKLILLHLHNSYHRREIEDSGGIISSENSYDNSIVFIRGLGSSFGIGLDIGSGFKLDLGFRSNGVFNHSFNEHEYSPGVIDQDTRNSFYIDGNATIIF